MQGSQNPNNPFGFFVVGGPEGFRQERQSSGPRTRYAFQDPNLAQQVELDIARVEVRQGHAEARQMEVESIIRAMNEIRSALDMTSLTVPEGDRGSTERPPLQPAFDDVNRGKLQNAYLRITERLVNYTDWMVNTQLGVPITNEIKKKDPEPPAVVEPTSKPTRRKKDASTIHE